MIFTYKSTTHYTLAQSPLIQVSAPSLSTPKSKTLQFRKQQSNDKLLENKLKLKTKLKMNNRLRGKIRDCRAFEGTVNRHHQSIQFKNDKVQVSQYYQSRHTQLESQLLSSSNRNQDMKRYPQNMRSSKFK